MRWHGWLVERFTELLCDRQKSNLVQSIIRLQIYILVRHLIISHSHQLPGTSALFLARVFQPLKALLLRVANQKQLSSKCNTRKDETNPKRADFWPGRPKAGSIAPCQKFRFERVTGVHMRMRIGLRRLLPSNAETNNRPCWRPNPLRYRSRLGPCMEDREFEMSCQWRS